MQLIETFNFLSLNFVHEKLTLDSTLAQKYSQKSSFYFVVAHDKAQSLSFRISPPASVFLSPSSRSKNIRMRSNIFLNSGSLFRTVSLHFYGSGSIAL